MFRRQMQHDLTLYATAPSRGLPTNWRVAQYDKLCPGSAGSIQHSYMVRGVVWQCNGAIGVSHVINRQQLVAAFTPLPNESGPQTLDRLRSSIRTYLGVLAQTGYVLDPAAQIKTDSLYCFNGAKTGTEHATHIDRPHAP